MAQLGVDGDRLNDAGEGEGRHPGPPSVSTNRAKRLLTEKGHGPIISYKSRRRKMAAPIFTDRELDVMAILWERGPSTVAEVRARLSDELAPNTVLTVLTVLESKGYVAHTEEGKAHRFRARVKQEIAGATAASRMVEKLF